MIRDFWLRDYVIIEDFGRPVVKIWVGGGPFVAEGLRGRHLLFVLQSSTFQPPGMQAVLRDPFSIQLRRISRGLDLESGHLLRSGYTLKSLKGLLSQSVLMR